MRYIKYRSEVFEESTVVILKMRLSHEHDQTDTTSNQTNNLNTHDMSGGWTANTLAFFSTIRSCKSGPLTITPFSKNVATFPPVMNSL